ncbi:TonB-dependent receptor plug domain-containing protein, partial [Acinetobacter baumannii]
VLLNGRRLAANAYDSGVTNLNIIPLAMLDRIEVLRDGASSIYGTDAIGGVINFITKKQFTG